MFLHNSPVQMLTSMKDPFAASPVDVEHTKFTLLKNSPLNTILTDTEGQHVYNVQTPFKFTHRTTTISHVQSNYETSILKDVDRIPPSSLNMTQVAQIDWRLFTSSILKYKGIEISVKDYLVSPNILDL